MAEAVQETNQPRRNARVWTLVLPVLLLGTIVVLLLIGTGASDAFVYSQPVTAVVRDPASHAGRQLRVEGELKHGSVKFREDPCEWRFTLQKSGVEMPVRFSECVVPDTFRDDMGITVTVQGKIQADGTFIANQVIPRCPSKYEMQQRQKNGERAPHAMTQM